MGFRGHMAFVLVPLLWSTTRRQRGLLDLPPRDQDSVLTLSRINPVLRINSEEGPSNLPKAIQISGGVRTQTQFHLDR